MTIKMTALVTMSLLVASAASAQGNELNPQLQINQQVRSDVRTEVQGEIAESRAFDSYRRVTTNGKIDDRLSGGAQVYNEATRKIGTVSGNLTVLAGNGSLTDVAQQFGLRVVNHDSRIGLGQLEAPEGVDLQKLVADIRASGLVKAVRIEVVEPRNELHVISR